ncbi:hypothetical protein ACFQS1_25460 [Paractinoplanes rhizophilus]|jgi:hypothetical protein|uniref:Serine peptidase n=1 Tax=Paractinoplanes rhizophilus TaxID=1416877 RepID=A0ABW2HWT6_9ACTN|nr:hypothetical protein [Actinoplanes sp.]
MPGIVGVHGVWNHLAGRTDEEAVRHYSEIWSGGLAHSLGDVTKAGIRAVYYASCLRVAYGQGAPDPETLDHVEQEWLREWDAALNPRVETGQGRALKPVRQIISGMARRGHLDERLTAAFVTVFLKEIKVYFDGRDPAPRQAARERVADAVRRERPSVLIAHSMGSVVAYEALWQNPDLKVDLLLTLGSPLGLPPAIFPRLDPAPVDGRGSRPPGVQRWVNIADPGDLVAVPRWLARSFDGIDEDLEAPIGVFEFHKVVPYLRCTQVADAVRPYL